MKVLILFTIFAIGLAHCPNGCSGHGKCSSQDRCVCHQNWEGADCSQRTCPHELAWVDTASRDNDAHYYAECANKGICDRKTGMCKCFDGYEGKGCQRSTCPNSCSGHGSCDFIDELATNSEDRRVGGIDGLTYATTNWDWQKIQGCKCDMWYEGADCSLRMCPMGDDPLTSISKFVHEKQRIALYQPSQRRTSTATADQTCSPSTSSLTWAVTLGDTADELTGTAYKVGDLVYIAGSTKLFQVATTTSATVISVDQLSDIGTANSAIYRVRSEILETADTTAHSGKTFTPLNDKSATYLAVGTRIGLEGSDLIYTIQTSGATITVDKTIVLTSTTVANAVAKMYVYSAGNPTGSFFVTYYDPYGGMWNTTAITISSSRTDDATAIQLALRFLPNHVLSDVQVSSTTSAGLFEDLTAKALVNNAYEFLVTFMGTSGTSGKQNLLEVEGRPTLTTTVGRTGSFPTSAGLFSGTSIVSGGYAMGVVSREGTAGYRTADRSELAYCSNRGLCDQETGQCTCFSGFRGLACEYQEALV